MQQNPTAIWQVSAVNQHVRRLLQQNFRHVWIEGELAEFTCAASGHWYFRLQDHEASLRCVMFRRQNQLVKMTPKRGDKIQILADLSLYVARGEFQCEVWQMQPAGQGDLLQQFEALKKELLEAGYFSEQHKKPLPSYPKTLGVIASSTSAALKDVIAVVERRYPVVIKLFDTLTQGAEAIPSLARAFELASNDKTLDAVLVVRGGGSLEDLQAYNQKAVVLSAFKCPHVLISGVGHETDTTLIDFVADVRAATPTAAAELVLPDRVAISALLEKKARQMTLMVQHLIGNLSLRTQKYAKSLATSHPKEKLAKTRLQISEYEQVLLKFSQHVALEKSRIEALQGRLVHAATQTINRAHQRLDESYTKIALRTDSQFARRQKKLALFKQSLELLNPKSVLSRGYALTTDQDGRIVMSKKSLKKGDELMLTLSDGDVTVIVK